MKTLSFKRGVRIPLTARLFPLFNIPRPLARPLHKQIQLYIAWKEIRHPIKARSHRMVLNEFFRALKINSATSLSDRDIQIYMQGLNGEFAKLQFKNALGQFLNYWYKMGLLEKEFIGVVNNVRVKQIGKNMHTEQVKRVQLMRKPISEGGEALSFRKIKLKMETEDLKTYDIHQLHRWSKYEVS